MDILIIKTFLRIIYDRLQQCIERKSTKQVLTHFAACIPVMISTGLLMDTYSWTHWHFMEGLCRIVLVVGSFGINIAIISSIDIKYELH